MKPSIIIYTELQNSYEYFNQTLFNNKLPNSIITLQRQKKSHGFFSPAQFIDQSGITIDEITLNPQYFMTQKIEDVLAYLVHAMVHLWQTHFAKPGRTQYHNKEWSQKMILLGLMPTSTGEPEGKKTGDKMSQYIIKNGLYEKSCQQLLNQEFRLSWFDRFLAHQEDETKLNGISHFSEEEQQQTKKNIAELIKTRAKPKKPNRSKFSHSCKEEKPDSYWAKPGLGLLCRECGQAYIEVHHAKI